MGDSATSPLSRDMASEPSTQDEAYDGRRPSTSSYGSGSAGAQDHAGHLHNNKAATGRGSVSSTEGYNEGSNLSAGGATYRRRPGSSHATLNNNPRPLTSGSEASSVRSAKSIINNGMLGDNMTMTGERSPSLSQNNASRVPKIVPMVARPGTAEDLSSFEYELLVRQQPKQARLCSSNDKLPKGPIDPPPVVCLQISRSPVRAQSQLTSHSRPPATANSDESSISSESNLAPNNRINNNNQASSKLTSASLIQSPYLFCFAALCKADEDEELYLLADGKTRYVTGNVVSSLYHLKDPRDGSAEGFFVFPDIGVRVEGTFRLKLSLYEMVDATVHHCKTVYTEPFQVYSPKRFPGVQDSTELSKSFATQGLKMRIKGGPARTGGKPNDGPPRTGNSEYSRPGSSSSGNTSAKRPRTATENAYNTPEESSKRRALELSPRSAYQRDLYGSFRHHPPQGMQEREMHSVPEAGVYQPRPVSSSYTAMRSEPDTPSHPSSIDARARFREQQYYLPRTAGGVPAYPPPVNLQRPTTAPTMASSHMADPYLQSSSRQRYPYPPPLPANVHNGRPSSSSGEHMPPPRFGPPAAPRYQPPESYESYQAYPQTYTTFPSHYAQGQPDAYLPRMQPPEPRSRPTSSSGGGQRITLPSLSEMIRRPDLDLPIIPASTSSLRTLLNPEAKAIPRDLSPSARERDRRASASSKSRAPSPSRSEEMEHPSEEDRRYYEIRARQMQDRRSSVTDDV